VPASAPADVPASAPADVLASAAHATSQPIPVIVPSTSVQSSTDAMLTQLRGTLTGMLSAAEVKMMDHLATMQTEVEQELAANKRRLELAGGGTTVCADGARGVSEDCGGSGAARIGETPSIAPPEHGRAAQETPSPASTAELKRECAPDMKAKPEPDCAPAHLRTCFQSTSSAPLASGAGETSQTPTGGASALTPGMCVDASGCRHYYSLLSVDLVQPLSHPAMHVPSHIPTHAPAEAGLDGCHANTVPRDAVLPSAADVMSTDADAVLPSAADVMSTDAHGDESEFETEPLGVEGSVARALRSDTIDPKGFRSPPVVGGAGWLPSSQPADDVDWQVS
jgi:hypothetical protein